MSVVLRLDGGARKEEEEAATRDRARSPGAEMGCGRQGAATGAHAHRAQPAGGTVAGACCQLGIPYHTTYVELNLAYINLATGASRTKPSPRHPRPQHTLNPATFMPRGYMLLPPSLHSQCVGIRLSIGLAEVGLPEYVTSTTKCLVQKIHNEWPLSDIVGNITQHSR